MAMPDEMPKEVRHDILKILNRVLKVLEKEYYSQLKALSNHTVHNASIFQDQDSVSIAVIIYALEKIVDLPSCDSSAFQGKFREAAKDLRDGKVQSYRECVKTLFRMIRDTDQKLKMYIHGISPQQTASLLGISQWELMEYLGTTTLMDRYPEEASVEKRLKLARDIFGLS